MTPVTPLDVAMPSGTVADDAVALVHESQGRPHWLPIWGFPAPQRAMPSTKSRVHPKYKTKYQVSNWPDYDRSLVERGNLTIWLSPAAIARWKAKPSRRRGGQPKYSDLAIETALTLRLLFQLPLRQVEGSLRSLFDLMGLALDVPDHTTLSRRGKH